MLCENCKQQDASVHITEINHATSQRMQRHFCPSCGELFQQSDIVQRMLGRLPMIKLRVAAVSAQRTVLNVLGRRHDGEVRSFVCLIRRYRSSQSFLKSLSSFCVLLWVPQATGVLRLARAGWTPDVPC